MALLFMDGFDHYSTPDLLRKWTRSFDTTATGSSPGINSTQGRRGGGAFGTSVWVQRNVTKVLAANYGTLIAGFAYKPAGFGTSAYAIAWFGDNSVKQITLGVTNDGKLALYRGGVAGTLLATTAAAVLTAGTYAYIELKAVFDAAAGLAEVRVNNNVVLTYTGGTATSANNYANEFTLGSDAGSNGAGTTAHYWDDLYIVDSTGPSNGTYLGDCRVDTVYPTGDGTYADMTPSTGTAHWSLVDEANPPSSTDYVTSYTVGHKDSYVMGDISVSGEIVGIQVNNAAFKDDVGTRFMANLVRSGTVDSQSAPQALNLTLTYHSTIHELDPATGLPWTVAGFNAAQIGTVVAG